MASIGREFLASNLSLQNEFHQRLKEVYLRQVIYPSFDFSETMDAIRIELQIDGIETHPKNLIQVDIQQSYVEVKIRNLKDAEFYFKIGRLSHDIKVKNSCYETEKGVLSLYLLKMKPEMWESINYHDPEVAVNYKRKMTEYMSNKVLGRQGHILMNLRCIDVICCQGFDIRYYFKNTPAISERIEESIENVIEYLYSDYLTNSSTVKDILLFAYAVYSLERRKVEQSYRNLGKEWPGRSLNLSKKFNSHSEKEEAENFKIKGNQFFKAKKYIAAYEAYSQAIKLDSKCSAYYFNRAITSFRLNNNYGCSVDLLEAIARDPFSGKAYKLLSKILLLRLMFDGSISFINRALSFDNNILIHEEIDKIYCFASNLNMYVKSVKLGNDVEKNVYLNYIVETHNKFKFPLSCVNVDIFNVCISLNYTYVVEYLVNILCQRGMTPYAKMEAKTLTQNPTYSIKSGLFYLLGLCSYYEDDEDEVFMNFKKFKECPMSCNLFLQIEQCNKIEKIFSERREGNKLYNDGRYEEAIKCYLKGMNNAISIVLSTLFYKIACAYFKLDREKDALINLNKAIDSKNKYHEAIVARGEYYLRKQKFSDALVNFEQAYNFHPCDRYKELINLTKLKQSSPFSDDDSLLKEISLQKSLANCKKNKGNNFFADNRYEEAIDAYSEAIELDSTNPAYFTNRAACYLELKLFSNGLKDCKKALEINSSFVKGFYRLSKCCIALGKPDDAITALEKALKINPNDKDLQDEKLRAECLKREIVDCDSAYKDEKYEIAEQNLSSALSKAEVCTDLRLKRIDCLINLEKFDKALTEAKFAASLASDNHELLYYMGVCHFYNQEKDKSLECLKQSIALKFDKRVSEFLLSVENVFKLKVLGDEAYEENRYEIALTCYEEGIRHHLKNKTMNSDFHFKIGAIYVKKNDIKEALKHFTSAINMQPKNGEAYKERGNCYLNLNLLDKALNDFEDLNKLVPNEEHETLVCGTKAKIETLSIRSEIEMENELLKLKEEKAKKYFNNKNYSESLGCYTAALRLSESTLIYLSRSECYMAMKDYNFAISDAKEAIKRDNNCLKGFIISGKCQILLGNAKEAIFEFEKAKQLEKCNKEVDAGIIKAIKLKKCLDNAEEALKGKRPNIAYDLYKCASRIAVGCSSILLSVAECLISLHRLPALSKLIESVNKSLQESSEYFCMKGLESYHKDEMSDTFKYLERALELDPSNEKYSQYLSKIRLIYEHKRKGNDAFFKGKYDEALQCYKEGLEIETDNIIVQSKFHYNIGVILKKQYMLSEAIEKFTCAISLKETYINALEKRAECYVAIKERDKAINDYQHLFEITKSQQYLKFVEHLKRPLNNKSATKEYYKILKVSPNASMNEIRKSYKALAKEWHPDRLRNNDKEIGEEKFKKINEAYSVLIDPLKRERYDIGEANGNDEFNFAFNPFMFHFVRTFFGFQ